MSDASPRVERCRRRSSPAASPPVAPAVATCGLTACRAPRPDRAPRIVEQRSPGDEGQSTAEACALIQDTHRGGDGGVRETPSDETRAPSSAGCRRLRRASPSLLPDHERRGRRHRARLQAMFERVAEVMAAIVAGDMSQVDELEAMGTRFQETTKKFQEMCAARRLSEGAMPPSTRDQVVARLRACPVRLEGRARSRGVRRDGSGTRPGAEETQPEDAALVDDPSSVSDSDVDLDLDPAGEADADDVAEDEPRPLTKPK